MTDEDLCVGDVIRTAELDIFYLVSVKYFSNPRRFSYVFNILDGYKLVAIGSNTVENRFLQPGDKYLGNVNLDILRILMTYEN